MSEKINRVGEVSYNKHGSRMEVVIYNNFDDMWVQFDKGKATHTNWTSFSKGSVKSPYDKSVCNIGYLGEGKYKSRVNGKMTPQYTSWRGMMNRSYYEKMKENLPTYKEVIVCEKWHNFQVFAEWFDQNYYKIAGQSMDLDKDIMVKGNKIYSPETCVFVPQSINKLFMMQDSKRGNFPLGVTYNKSKNKYQAQVSKTIIGYYNTPEESFNAYKVTKEYLIKQKASEYKNEIPERLYNIMINYKVEFND